LRRLSPALLMLLLLAACTTPRLAPPPGGASFVQEGAASWYGRAHHGRRTASGERFDMRALTAAHRTLPFDTVLRVTNLENGKNVTVRVNDRGPYVSGRIIDLSAAAAAALGMHEDGIANVRLEAFAADQRRASHR
jgi:rare lipoprotein A